MNREVVPLDAMEEAELRREYAENVISGSSVRRRDEVRRLLATLDQLRAERIDAEGLRALSEAATPGPWEYVTMKAGMADARFVVAAVNFVRAALASRTREEGT